MIGYLDELNNNSIINDIKNYKVVLCGDILWITNYIKILEYSKETIKLKVKNNTLTIEGVDIVIVMLEKKEIILRGKFNNIYIEKPFKVDEKNETKI